MTVVTRRYVPDSLAVRHNVTGGVTGSGGNLADLVRHAAQQRPDRVALWFGHQRLTWAELDHSVDTLARGLAARHAPGDRVAVALGNVPDFARVYFGALRAGLVAVPVNPGYRAGELTHVLSDSGAATLVASPAVARDVADARSGLPLLRRVYVPGGHDGTEDLADLAVDGEPVAGPPRGGEDLAVLLYTSGAEGRPKGAMLSHRALLANLDQLDAVQPHLLGPNDVVLLALPLFHSYGLGPGLHAVARHACTAVLVERFDPADTLDLMRRHSASVVLGVPQMYLAWSQLDSVSEAFGSVRLAVSGAAPLEAEASRRFRDVTGHQVFEGYGLTEAAPVLASSLMSPVPKAGSIGRPIPGVELKLVGMDGHTIEIGEEDEESSPGTDPGEIWARGANLFSGYWPDGRDGPDPEGWWPTADIGYADADGDLFLVDRLRELILVSGFNVYPREVEQVLESHPAVREAAVLGVPDPRTGEAVQAYLVLEPGSQVTVEELTAYCQRNLARFKCPSSVEFVAALPHSVTGKVRKSLLRDGLPQPRGDGARPGGDQVADDPDQSDAGDG